MPIRTAEEYRAALARLDQERIILASRSFTDDEQRDFEALVRDIETYKASGSTVASTWPAPPTSSEPATSASRESWRDVVDQQNLRAATPHASKPPAAIVLRGGTAADMRASMERELRRAGMTPVR